MSTLQFRQKIRSIVESQINDLGFDVVAIELTSGRSGALLRVRIDKPGGVTARNCMVATHEINSLLDDADPIDGRYTLEVSSPGIDRPVERVADFIRFTGYKAKIRLVPGYPRRRYTGVLAGVEEGEILLDADNTQHRLQWDAIEHAQLVLSLEEYKKLSPSVSENAPAEVNSNDQ